MEVEFASTPRPQPSSQVQDEDMFSSTEESSDDNEQLPSIHTESEQLPSIHTESEQLPSIHTESEQLPNTLSPPRFGYQNNLIGPRETETPENQSPVSPIIGRSQAIPRRIIMGDRDELLVEGENEQPEPAVEVDSDETSDEVEIIANSTSEGVSEEINVEVSDNEQVNNDIVVSQVDTSALDFQDGPAAAQFDKTDENDKSNENDSKDKKKNKGKKRKAAESVDEENDEGSCCTICFEKWTNSGNHRISSLKCGHFFGYQCIEKWLRSGSSCPNCNEKSSKKDLRVHYVAKLAAIDTGEKDRALADLERTRVELRELQLRQTELKVRLKLQSDQILRLENDARRYREGGPSLAPEISATQPQKGAISKLVYLKRHEICRPNPDRDKTCRVLAFSQYHGMLVVSQPGANPLFPGFGVRRFNLLDQKLGNFVHLAKEVVRDLSFHPTQPELLLSCGQGKEARITNISSCYEVAKFSQLDTEVWACDWGEGGHTVYLGTKRSQVAVLDTRAPNDPPTLIPFQGTERRPIIGLRSVPACPESGFNHPGILVLTLGSLWFWEIIPGGNTVQHRLPAGPPNSRFWSLSYEPSSRLVLVVCKPSPLATHLVLELVHTRVEGNRTVTANLLAQTPGGSYSARSFLRSALVQQPFGGVLLVYGRGTGSNDHKVTVREVGTDRIQQEVNVGKPVLDIQSVTINGNTYLAVLGETELTMYRWE